MSHKATNWAVEQRGLKPATKVVLWHLADRHNREFGCFPSQALLAHDCEMSRASLNNHLKLLEERGLIRRIQSRNSRTFKQENTRYLLAFEDGFTPQKHDDDKRDAGPLPCPETGHGNDAEPVSKNDEKPCPKNDDSRVQNLDTNPVREPVTQPGNAQARGERDFEARSSKKVEKLFWKLVKDWPQLHGMPKQRARSVFEQLSAEEQDQAIAKREVWLKLLKSQGKDHVPAPTTYLSQKLWKDIPADFDLAGEQAAQRVAAPFGKMWGAIRFADLMREPYGPAPRFTSAEERMVADGIYQPAELMRQKLVSCGWPRVNTLHERAIRKKHGTTEDPALAPLADLFGQVGKGSELWSAWKGLHAERGWPWFGEDRDCPDWVWLPDSPCEADTYDSASDAVRAAMARFENQHASISERQAAE
ncbi:hypothetical protein FIV00_15015 [Labrenzia sp. THAF82]|uniref:helix-turn-helix domain-containing protein n=1 Tax=Labrenzia sp. THAF82 TaxID=2587861 RepID=UPI001267FBFA|nr:helix-turn-helix domain-containing protein [Labrenzia sp. THAF82]QFT31801.1 hypothetical protein FIV00_15015 [Labrenzia sp. THAF82]